MDKGGEARGPVGRQLLIRPLIPRFSQDRAPAVLLWVKSSKPTKKKKKKIKTKTKHRSGRPD